MNAKPHLHDFLNRLMHDVATARDLQEVYHQALRHLQTALSVERAAILLFDDTQAMRFVAWQGLSDGYRHTVEEHSPWSADAENAAPVLISDVFCDEELAAYNSLFVDENIAALALIPLPFGDGLLGKFMLCYAEPHPFDEAEIALAQAIAGQSAFAIAHHRIKDDLKRRLHLESQAHQRLIESEGHLRLALAAGTMGIWDWNLKTNILHWSLELQRQHGIKPGCFDGTFEAFARSIHHEDRQRIDERIQETLRQHRHEYVAEYRINHPIDGVRWMAAQGRVLFDDEGAPIRMVGVCNDITERKRLDDTRQFLSDASQLLQASLDHEKTVQSLARLAIPRMADGCAVHLIDENGQLQAVEVTHHDPSKAAMAWQAAKRWPSKLSAASGIGLVFRTGQSLMLKCISADMLLQAAQNAEHLKILRELNLHSVMIVPLNVRGRTIGVMTFAAAESKRAFSNQDLSVAEELAGRAALAIDNARLFLVAEQERRTAEKATRKVRVLAEASNTLAASLDPQSALRELARYATSCLADYCVSYSFDGQKIERVGLSHRDPAKQYLVENLVQAGPPSITDSYGAGMVIRTGQPSLVSDVPADMLVDGAQNTTHLQILRQLQPCSTMIMPLFARSRVIGAVAFVNTVDSGYRYTHNELELAQELASRAALLVDNARLYHEAQRAIGLRDETVAVVSHDLRTPLHNIMMASEILAMQPSPERIEKCHTSIQLAVRRMSRLMEDLLDIARIEADGLSVNTKPEDMRSLVHEALSVLQPLIEEKRIAVQQDIESSIDLVMADRDRLLQALGNILSNAVKFIPVGGMIRISGKQQGGRVVLSIADNGPGISAAQLAHLFDRHWQADRRSRTGIGLGLAIAKGIVDAHGGSIAVESEVGKGATFSLRLFPATRQPKAATASRQEFFGVAPGACRERSF